MPDHKSAPPGHKLTLATLSHYLDRFRAARPRLAPKGSAAARAIEAEQTHHPLTFWGVLVRLLPAWVLIIVVLIIEPGLPLQALRSLTGVVTGWISPTAPASDSEPIFVVQGPREIPVGSQSAAPNWDTAISRVFMPQVQRWGDSIAAWSLEYRIRPNLIATLIQLESCGNPDAVSASGKQGLFQPPADRLPSGSDALNPETNARAGLGYFAETFATANGDIGLTLAAYHGGDSIFVTSPTEWPTDIQLYQFWGGGIYEEAEMGLDESPTLQEWLDNGGGDLCAQAAAMN